MSKKITKTLLITGSVVAISALIAVSYKKILDSKSMSCNSKAKATNSNKGYITTGKYVFKDNYTLERIY